MPLILKNEPHVQFKEIADIFIVSFNRPSFSEATTVAGKDGKTIAETRVKTRVKARVKILSAISANSIITREELARSLNVTIKGIDWHVSKMKREGVLRRIGPDKGGYWEALK